MSHRAISDLLHGARRDLGGRSDLDARVAGLAEAVEACRGRVPDEDIDPLADLVERASGRLRLSADHTVVALAGATGSGKSSTFNALVGLDLSSVGVRRPTTSWASACTWGAGGSQELLEWLGIPPRHQSLRDSMLDSGSAEHDLQGLVLLDLPDHDSTETSHHLEVDRLVELADLVVWVLDPQKYADAAIHERFLAPLSGHREVMLVVLNHVDEIEPHRRGGLLADLRRLLDADGLAGIPMLAISARSGEGLDELRAELAGRVAAKAASGVRIRADLDRAVARLGELSGDVAPRELGEPERRQLVDAVVESAGVPAAVDAVRRSSLARCRRATGWPPISWVGRLRPDPLDRLREEVGAHRTTPPAGAPSVHPVQPARVEHGVRAVVDTVTTGLTPVWRAAVRRASLSDPDRLGDRLDHAVRQAGPGAARVPAWGRLLQVVQWLLVAVVLAGALWWAAGAAGVGSGRWEDPPRWLGHPAPLWLVLGGLLLGLVLAGSAWLPAASAATGRARRTEERLRSGVAEVVDEAVIDPVRTELDACARAGAGLRRARG